MVLAEPKHIEADLVGELDLLDDVGEALVDIDWRAGLRIAPGLDEGVSANCMRALDNARFAVRYAGF